MNPTDAERIFRKLMREHVPGWKFEWMPRARSHFGLCSFENSDSYKAKTLYLSRPLTLLNEQPMIEWVAKHEIAHALAGEKGDFGHGRIWKRQARALGIKPSVCWSSRMDLAPVMIEGNVLATCPECGTSFRQHKVSYALFKTQACAVCWKKGRGKIVRFTVTRADTGEPIPCPAKPKPRRRKRRYAR